MIMEKSGYKQLIHSNKDNIGSFYFNNESSSLKTSTIEIIKNELLFDNTINPVITNICPSTK